MKLPTACALLSIAAAAIASACAPTMSKPAEYAEQPISAKAGEDYFLRKGGGDPYATGMAYPLFLALMEAYPDELGRDWHELAEKFGFIEDPEAKGDPRAPAIGFHLTTDPNTRVPWLVANCQMCHADRLRLSTGDVIVPGLGNKRVRPHAYQIALAKIGADPNLDEGRIKALATSRAREWRVPWNQGDAIVRATLAAWRPLQVAAKPYVARFADGLPGRTATIESFALALGAHRRRPIPMPVAIGWAKIPDVRSFPFRETFSYDGSGYGSPQALVLEADFLFGTRAEWYREHPHIATSMYLYLKGFTRHLPYPAKIDAELATRGKGLFEARCSQCHGFYVDHGDEMRVSYKERVVPKEVVGTDPARVDAVTPAFVEAANSYELVRGYTRVRNTGGYVPPVLLDVWARGLLGHAGQWPSLEALATPPDERPRRIVVDTRGLYDLERVGVRYEIVGDGPVRPLRAGEYLHDGTQAGLRVEGHTFLSDLPPDDRRAAIEYLKTL